MGGRAGGGPATCCGVANVGPRRAALGPGGSGDRDPAGAHRERPAPAQPEPCGAQQEEEQEALPAAGTRTRPARQCPVDAGQLELPSATLGMPKQCLPLASECFDPSKKGSGFVLKFEWLQIGMMAVIPQ
ncbi:hypothetical protein TURU_100746 [Turdus rufiventris]|nr:hypothetical protein TURU_100746 [Turdus rufiventris]